MTANHHDVIDTTSNAHVVESVRIYIRTRIQRVQTMRYTIRQSAPAEL